MEANQEGERQGLEKEHPNQVNTEAKHEETHKRRKTEASTKKQATKMREVHMQEKAASKDSQEETMKEDHNQVFDFDDMEVDLQVLITVHGEK